MIGVFHLPLQDHRLCYSDCHFTHTAGNATLTFDFTPLGSVGSLMNGPSFTSKGTKYFHHFNISLCGGQVAREDARSPFRGHVGASTEPHSHFFFFPFRKSQLAVCTDNVTDLSIGDSQRERGEGANTVRTFICQSTIIPANGRGFHTALSSQSITLADTFLGE